MGIFSSKHEGANDKPATSRTHAKRKKPPPKKEITDHERAILDLKNQRDKLHLYRKQVRIDVSQLNFIIISLFDGMKMGAGSVQNGDTR